MGVRPTERQLVAEVPVALAGLLDVPKDEVKMEQVGSDLLLRAARRTFVVGVLEAAGPGPLVTHAQRVVTAARKLRRKATPLLAVPFMTEAGRRACEGASVHWFDLSGNAHIVAPGLRIIVDGRPNRFRIVGRPLSTFAPKSARVTRWLLMHPGKSITQRQIARGADMTEGFVSRIASRLVEDNYIVRERCGALRVNDPALLLDTWRAEYKFDRHSLTAGSVAARSGEALTRFVSDTLARANVEHAATGLCAAWQFSRYASFRIGTFFLTEPPSDEVRDKLVFRDDPRGANLWLVVPNDVGVFQGAADQGGVRCVHPVQAYMDLKGHPERAAEAANRLRADILMSWKPNG